MPMKTIHNHHFRDDGTRPARRFMSGLPLPLDTDGVVRNHKFTNCSFHPDCASVRFVDCEFVNCNPHGPADNYTDCAFRTSYGIVNT